VLERGKVLSSLRCAAGVDSLMAFSGELVEFGDGVEASKSRTPLLELDDTTDKIERLYPVPGSAYP